MNKNDKQTPERAPVACTELLEQFNACPICRCAAMVIKPDGTKECACSVDSVPDSWRVGNIGNPDILKDQINGFLDGIDSELRAVSIGVNSGGQLGNAALEVIKFGLNSTKLTLKMLNLLCITHNGNAATCCSNVKVEARDE